MTINGLKVDADKIGAGMYDIICEKGEEAIVAFGMIPKWIIDLLEDQIRRKLIEVSAAQIGCTPDEFKPYIDEKKVKDTIGPIVHQVCLAIYSTAKQRGMMVV